MGFFKKQINAKATELYFRHAVDSILSDSEMNSHKARLLELSDSIPEFKSSSQETFNKNLTAANLQILDFAWAELQKANGIDMIQAVQFNFELKRAIKDIPRYEEYDDLYSSYNQAVAHATLQLSSIDQMAYVFIKNVISENTLGSISDERVEEIHKLIAGLMQGSFINFVNDMKELKLIS